MDVARYRQKVFLGVNEYRSIPSAKQRPVPAMSPIKSLSVDSVEMAHGPGQIPLRRLQKQMVMIVHQTVRVNLYTPLPACLSD